MPYPSTSKEWGLPPFAGPFPNLEKPAAWPLPGITPPSLDRRMGSCCSEHLSITSLETRLSTFSTNCQRLLGAIVGFGGEWILDSVVLLIAGMGAFVWTELLCWHWQEKCLVVYWLCLLHLQFQCHLRWYTLVGCQSPSGFQSKCYPLVSTPDLVRVTQLPTKFYLDALSMDI
jgi:hypothetical protein